MTLVPMYSLQETTSTSTQFMLQPMGGVEHEGATTHALLKNVESVYIESMTQDDKVQELLRTQEKSEQQQRRQNEEMEKLRSQCQTATREIRKNQEVRAALHPPVTRPRPLWDAAS